MTAALMRIVMSKFHYFYRAKTCINRVLSVCDLSATSYKQKTLKLVAE